MSVSKPLFLGNWKMNMLPAEVVSFAKKFNNLMTPVTPADSGIAGSFTTLQLLSEGFAENKSVLVGAQNVHWEQAGAFTGEVSASMLKPLGLDFCIIGHSERRTLFAETDETVSKRAKAALEAGFAAVVCVGETKAEYEAGKTNSVIENQLKGSLADVGNEFLTKLVIAYEPVWAIGTGLAATPEQAESVHCLIREQLVDKYGNLAEVVPILYGGSTKAENIAGLISRKNVDGALVGGASLKPESFWALVENGRNAFVD